MKKIAVPHAAFLLCLIGLIGSGAGHAATLSGTVLSAQGQPLAGALATLIGGDKVMQETVYSNAAGRFRLDTAQQGEATLRLRAPGYADVTQPLRLGAADSQTIAVALKPLTDPKAVSDALPASAHAATVKINDEKANAAYRNQCFFCHQIGNAWTRRPKSQEEWNGVLDRMQRYGALITWGAEKSILRALSEAFRGQPVADREDHRQDAVIATAKLTEVRIGDASSFVHDVELGPDGRFYSVDMGNDIIYITDLASGKSEAAPMPREGLPRGGEFAGMSAPIATFNAYHGPHSIVVGPDGRYYTTNSMMGELGIFDPKTRQYQFVKIGHGALYPHTLRFDRDGILWFTLAMSDQLGRYDPKTGRVDVMALPAGGFWQWLADTLFDPLLRIAAWFPGKDLQLILSHHKWSGQGHKIMNLPYGLDVHPGDGSVWYSKLYGDKIGRYDPRTGAIKEWDTPLTGPRRMRFGADGVLWIPAFGDSGLMKFDPKTEKFTSYPMPVLAQGEFETPYALNVHPRTGEVWVTANLSDRMFRFDPRNARWIVYPLSSQTTYMRDIVFAPDGRVCSVNANLPAAAIEGQQQQIVCLQPDAYPEANSNTPNIRR
ncbi:MAG: carboxypeptidase regulatory-like domain-containing protein [Sterolibacterium sp.]|jgi:streptogramin lyase